MSLVVIASSVTIFFDARRLGARKGVLGGGLLDMGQLGWFFSSLFLWIVAVPCYPIARRRLIRANAAREARRERIATERHPLWSDSGAPLGVALAVASPTFAPKERPGRGSVAVVVVVVAAFLAFDGWQVHKAYPRTIDGTPVAAEMAAPAPSDAAGADALVERVALHTADFKPGYTMRLMPGGDQVVGQVTLDVCGYAFTSEQHRVARRQYTLFDQASRRAGVSNEVVAYDTPADAVQALTQWRTAVAHCPHGLITSTVAGEPLTYQQVSHNAASVTSLPNAHNAITVISIASKGHARVWVTSLLQVHGRVLDILYVVSTTAPKAPFLADATRLGVIAGRRLAAD